DGTQVGTVAIKDPTTSAGQGPYSPNTLTNVQGTLYFTASDGTHGRELWTSNGSAAGTAMVFDINQNMVNQTTNADANPQFITPAAGLVFFTADDGVHGRELWKTNGAPGGTSMVQDLEASSSTNPINLTERNGKLYFAATGDSSPFQTLWV